MRWNPFSLLVVAFALLSLSLPSTVAGGAGGDGAGKPRPRIGLVLSGGGARGAAHIGVLQVLEELRIPVDVVVGTSMGSLVGGGYAAGLSPQELEARVTHADWDALFTDDPPRKDWPARRKQQSTRPLWDFTIGVHDGQFKLPKGAISGQQVQLFFNDLVKGAETIQDFDDLPIPFRAVATDLEDGEMRVFEDGPLPVAMRASMSVPTLFAPMEWQGHLYVDGGLVRNLPVDVARGLGVDVIIAVNLGSSYLPRAKLDNIVGVTGQMIAILTEKNVQESLRQLDPARGDVLIAPELGGITSSDFKRAPEAIATGVTAARKMRPQLARYSVGEEEYAQWKAARFGQGHPASRIDEVRIAGLHRVNPDLFTNLAEAQQGRYLNRRRLVSDMQHLYARSDFERISYRFEPGDLGGSRLIVDALEKSWGPGYLGMGFGLSTDYRGETRLGMRGLYNRTWVNHLGAEWTTDLTLGNVPRLFTEFYQPLNLERAAFVAPYLDFGSIPYSVFRDKQRVARYDEFRSRIGVDLGTTVREVELRAGVYYGSTKLTRDTGLEMLQEPKNVDSGVRARLVYDTLDSVGAPRSGTRLALDLMSPLKSLGANVQYARFQLALDSARSWGDNTFAFRLRGGSSFGTRMPYYDEFTLGGFLNLSGNAIDQFRGREMALGALVYYRRIATLSPPIGRGIYLGASLESGWLAPADVINPATGLRAILTPATTRYGGSLFLGTDTWIGPAYLALGRSGSGEQALYFLIGRP